MFEDTVLELASDLTAAPIIQHSPGRPSLADALLGLEQPVTEPALA
jgi:hypothetical protein